MLLRWEIQLSICSELRQGVTRARLPDQSLYIEAHKLQYGKPLLQVPL